MNRSKNRAKALFFCAAASASLTFLVTTNFAQSAKVNSAAKGKPSPTPTPVPTPTPPVDTKCYVGSGCIDAAFGNNGVRMLPGESMQDTALQPDGKIVTVGYGPGTAGSADAIIARLNTDGTLDNTFGDVDPQNPLIRLGYRYDDVDTLTNRATTVAIQPDGRIVVGMSRVDNGSSWWTFVRLESNGERDISFGNAGVVRSNIGVNSPSGLTLQSDGRIIATGGGFVARFNYDGSPDTTFGTNGSGVVNGLGFMVAFYSAAIQTILGEERIVLGGKQIFITGTGNKNNQHSEFLIFRLLPNGQPDPSFGSGGKVNTSFGYTDILSSIRIDANNLIIAGGLAGTAGPQAAAVARYTENGALDLTFGSGTGKVTAQVNGFRTTSQDLLLQTERS